MSTYCELTEKQFDNMSDIELDKCTKCNNASCFDCYGDSTQEY